MVHRDRLQPRGVCPPRHGAQGVTYIGKTGCELRIDPAAVRRTQRRKKHSFNEEYTHGQ